MEASLHKSNFLFNNVSEVSLSQTQGLSPYKADPIDKGIKYLGFMLKPNCYGIDDWR